MNTLTSGHAHVRYLLAEHRRLDQLLHRTVTTLPSFEERDATGWLARTRSGLAAIRQELDQHFRQEEAGGCLEEAVVHCPALASEAAALLAEHAQLRRELELLIARCEDIRETAPDEQVAVGQELRGLVRRLHRHEALENRIMERAFAINCESGGSADTAAPPCDGRR